MSFNPRPYSIWTSDIAITDIDVRGLSRSQITELLAPYIHDFSGRDKFRLASKPFCELLAKINPENIAVETAGGTVSNILVNLKRILGPVVAIDFQALIGESECETNSRQRADRIRQDYIQAGIQVSEPAENFEPSITLAFRFENGNKLLVTTPGGAGQFVAEQFRLPTLQNANAAFFSGSLPQKTNWDCWNNLQTTILPEQELWVTLPTDLAFVREPFNSECTKELLRRASGVGCNMDELIAAFGLHHQKARALSLLQNQLGVHAPRHKFCLQPSAIVTDGSFGAWTVTADEIDFILAVPDVLVKNNLGAGDTAIGAWLTHRILGSHGLGMRDAAEMAAILSAEKIRLGGGARLADPLQVLDNVSPHLAKTLKFAKASLLHATAA
jgi:sugar/nucleoside kinase (ribokinase family)